MAVADDARAAVVATMEMAEADAAIADDARVAGKTKEMAEADVAVGGRISN